MHRVPVRSLVVALLGLALSPVVLAKKDKQEVVDLTTPESTLASAELVGMLAQTKLGKKQIEGLGENVPPHRVAIGSFVVRYAFEDQVVGDVGWELSAADYESLTEGLYAVLEQELAAHGFEVVPRAEVVAGQSFQALHAKDGKEGESNRKGEARVTWPQDLPPSGFLVGKKIGHYLGIQRDVGADAVISAYANLGICRNGSGELKPCLQAPGCMTVENGIQLSMDVGYREQGAGLNYLGPKLGFLKAKENVTLKDGTCFDRPLVWEDNLLQDVLAAGFFRGATFSVDEQAFAEGVAGLYTAGLRMGLAAFQAQWEETGGKK